MMIKRIQKRQKKRQKTTKKDIFLHELTQKYINFVAAILLLTELIFLFIRIFKSQVFTIVIAPRHSHIHKK